MERHHKRKCSAEFKCEKNSHKDKCEKKDKCKKDKCKKEKKCKSSSSSSSCEKLCVPRVTQQICANGGVISLSLTAVVDTPNHDQPPTFTCPSQIGQQIYITFTITNTGNVTLKSPIYTYDSWSGVNKVTCGKLHAGQSKVITVHHKISNCQCKPGNNLSIVANAYSNLHKNCLILVSPPIGIPINQTV
jgi:hypothetical protein